MSLSMLKNKVWLSSQTVHGDELKYIREAYKTNRLSTVGYNIYKAEKIAADIKVFEYAVTLSHGTSALRLCIKSTGVKPEEKVYYSDLHFSATVNPIIYKGIIPVFIDSERDTWNISTEALEKAFELYPYTKYIVTVNLYEASAKYDEICRIADKHGAQKRAISKRYNERFKGLLQLRRTA